jgi:prepilin-type N-terminal cleavage/methylation domain-containing protein
MTHGRGLTLLELMLALTIFSLVSLAVFMVFRTGRGESRVGGPLR